MRKYAFDCINIKMEANTMSKFITITGDHNSAKVFNPDIDEASYSKFKA